MRLCLFIKGDLYCQFSSLFGNWDLWTIGTLGHWDLWIIETFWQLGLWAIGKLRPFGNWDKIVKITKNHTITVIKDITSDINELYQM